MLYLKNRTTNFVQTFSVPCPRPYQGLWTFFMQYYPQTKNFWQENYFFISRFKNVRAYVPFTKYVRAYVPLQKMCVHMSRLLSNVCVSVSLYMDSLWIVFIKF